MASPKSVIAATLVYVQAGLVALAGLALVTFAARRRRSWSRRFINGHLVGHPGLWGLVLLIAAAALVIVGVGLYRRRKWATPATYVAEAIVGLGGLIGFHPVRSLLGLALAVVVVVLVAIDAAARQPSVTSGP